MSAPDPIRSTSFLDRTRDKFAHWAINSILWYVATPWYRTMITGLLAAGDTHVRETDEKAS